METKTRAELIERIEVAMTEHKGFMDYQDHLNVLNGILDTLGFEITIDDTQDGIICVYYSGKLHKSIILDWDSYHVCNNAEELADHLMAYETEAQELEAKLVNNLP